VFGLFDNVQTAKSAKKTLAADKDLKLFLVDPILEADPI
jgi:hypothetical protein